MSSPVSLLLVCVVEGERAFRALLCAQLERAGFATVQAVDGSDGLAIAERTGAAVVVVNVIASDTKCLALIRTLKQNAPATRILAISGGDDDYLKLASSLGADAVMAKPFGAKDLTECVKRIATTVPRHGVERVFRQRPQSHRGAGNRF